MNDNFRLIVENFDLSEEEMVDLSVNAIKASFLPQNKKEKLMQQVQNFKNVTKS